MNKRDKTIQRLRVLEQSFPDDLMLFAASGTLMLVDDKYTIIETFIICCDGGDPDIDGDRLLLD